MVPNAGQVDWYVIFGTIDRARGWEGVRAVLVPKDAAGLTVGAADEKSGLWALRTADVVLEDVRVPKANVLSGAASTREGIERFMARVQIVNAARAVGIARAAYEYALDYAKEREAFGEPSRTTRPSRSCWPTCRSGGRRGCSSGRALCSWTRGERPQRCAQALVQANLAAGKSRSTPCRSWEAPGSSVTIPARNGCATRGRCRSCAAATRRRIN
jgi:hypothetical protein